MSIKYLIVLFLGLAINFYPQDFLPEHLFAYLPYANNVRDKFLPDWQNTIKNNKISQEIYIATLTFDEDSESNPLKGVPDSTVFSYDGEGKLISLFSNESTDEGEVMAKIKTDFFYENGLLIGSMNSAGQKLTITRDPDGKILKTSYEEQEDTITYSYNYTSGKLTKISMKNNDEVWPDFILEDSTYRSENEDAKMYSSSDKYGRIINVYSHNIGLETEYDNMGRLSFLNFIMGGSLEMTRFKYAQNFIEEIIFESREGEVAADLKDTRVTKSVKTVVKYY
jgi:hypothetical protein